jgi:hypothetical protein
MFPECHLVLNDDLLFLPLGRVGGAVQLGLVIGSRGRQLSAHRAVMLKISFLEMCERSRRLPGLMLCGHQIYA